MSNEIYYFSGTGNSLFIAQELKERLPNANIFTHLEPLHDPTSYSDQEVF